MFDGVTLVNTAWGDKAAAVQIRRTPEFTEMARQLSNCIAALPLTPAQNDELIERILAQIAAAERGAFLHGFELGAE